LNKNFIHKLSILYFFIIANVFSFAQDADSLLEFRFAEMPDDSLKVMELYKRGFEERTKNIQNAFVFAKACESAALNTKSNFLIAKANNLLGILYFKTGQLGKAESYQLQALNIWNKINNKEGIGLTLTNLGNIFSNKNQKEDAENTYLQALQIFNELNNEKQKANTLNNLGILKFENNEVAIAKRYFLQAYQIGEKLNDYELKAFCLNNIGATFEAEKNWTEAWAYYDDARELRELMDNQIDLIDSYINLASVSLANNKINDAKNYLIKAKKNSEEQQYAEGKIATYELFLKFYLTTNKSDSALLYQQLFYEEKLKLIEESKDAETNFIPTDNSKTEQQSIEELKNQNYVLYYLIAVLSVFLLMLIYLLFRQKK
jgi:tetratricopeptide (TPR) repeat protein